MKKVGLVSDYTEHTLCEIREIVATFFKNDATMEFGKSSFKSCYKHFVAKFVVTFLAMFIVTFLTILFVATFIAT